MDLKVNDLVTRISYNNDVVFKIASINQNTHMAMLKGVTYRLDADSPLSDLKLYQKDNTNNPPEPSKVKTLGKNRKF